MADVDDEVVERVLAGMREWASERLATAIADAKADMCRQWSPYGLLEAVARDPSLFRAVELRRAELLREQDFPGGRASR